MRPIYDSTDLSMMDIRYLQVLINATAMCVSTVMHRAELL